MPLKCLKIKKRLESASKDPMKASKIAASVIKGKWPRVESVILQNRRAAMYYAQFALKQRWPEAENVIMQDAFDAATYALTVIEGRWPEAESSIKQDSYIWNIYKKDYNIKE